MTTPGRAAAPLLAVLLGACGTPGGVDGTTAPTGPLDSTPITAPAETWTWIPLAGAHCADGSTTGIGVNLTTRSSDLLVYFEGGGACWDALTCLTLGTAVHLTGGYGPAEFAAEAPGNAPGFARAAAANPFKDASWVFVPYCTGDLNAGTTINTYGGTRIHHVGARNVDAILARLVPTFPHAGRVYVTGSSAGGFAAQINYPTFAAAFPAAQVHALADSAQAVPPVAGRYAEWQAAWHLPIPAGCTACASDISALPGYLAGAYPNGRFGLLAFVQDSVLPNYFGVGAAGFGTETLALLGSAYDPHANARYFVLTGPGHTMLGASDTITGPGNVPLAGWLGQWWAGGAGWVSVKP